MLTHMPTVHLLHGIYNENPELGVGQIEPYLKPFGFNVKVHTYGFRFAIQTRWLNPKTAKRLLPEIEKGDIVIGHSNGCTIWYLLSKLLVEENAISGAVLINPALDSDRAFGNLTDWIHVYHNKDDTVVWWSKFLPFGHPWGVQGRIGFTGDDSRYVNFDCQEEEPKVIGHSDIFSPGKIEEWGPRIAEQVFKAFIERNAQQAVS